MLGIFFDIERWPLLDIVLVSFRQVLYLFIKKTLIPKQYKHLEALSFTCLQPVW